ncbi:hypothetical protein SAMN05216412_11266 [Nitrosospira multiformis]|uniref:Uncharacterized protein n=1 Tax=Nitrosospira multiformis TaxID=1231 RepID=A0A1I0GAT9_9PROT|nr:hypothetical protein [Nitrosospira multiformis]SET68023.1 hypothetical protein SAMN05216412_11266 [Nitrosospira multiformis]
MSLTKENAPAATEATFKANSGHNYKRLPPYGKQLMSIREAGKAPARMVIVAFDWDLGKAYPRIIIPNNLAPTEIEFRFLAGLPVQITYRSKDAHRVDAVAQEIARVNPCFLATFAFDLAGTGDAWAILKPYESTKIAEAA